MDYLEAKNRKENVHKIIGAPKCNVERDQGRADEDQNATLSST